MPCTFRKDFPELRRLKTMEKLVHVVPATCVKPFNLACVSLLTAPRTKTHLSKVIA
jgi:hypothetical protein